MYGLLSLDPTRLAIRLRTVAFATCAAAALLLIPAVARAETFEVTTTADGGPGSLRQAIIDANNKPGHDIIELPPGVYTLTVGVGAEGPTDSDPTAGDLDILEGVTIIGVDGDPAKTIIQASAGLGSATHRVFDILLDNTAKPGLDMSVELKALTIRHGAQTYPTAIHAGGGIQFFAANGPGKLTIYNSIVTANAAAASGGGISAASNGQAGTLLRIERSAITANAAGAFEGLDESRPDFRLGGSGGGIEVGPGLPVQIVESLVAENTSWHGELYNGQGGGLYLWDDAGSATPSFIHNSIIERNHAQDAGAAGGGLYVGRSLQVVNSTISNNYADGSGGGIAVSVADGHTVAMGNVTVSGNQADGMGGGIYIAHGGSTGPTIGLVNLTVTGNRSDADGAGGDSGGGLRRQDSPAAGHIYLHNSIVAGNFSGTGQTADDMVGTTALDPSSSHNLVGVGGDGLDPDRGNLLGTADAMLGPLADNGSLPLPGHVGVLLTHALLADSPALDAGSDAVLESFGLNLQDDARGPVDSHAGAPSWPRRADAADLDLIKQVDIGALEQHPAVAAGEPITLLQGEVESVKSTIRLSGDPSVDEVTVKSSDTSIVPDPVMTGTGAARTLTLTPAPGQHGEVAVTVTATAQHNGTVLAMTDDLAVKIVPRPDLTVTADPDGEWWQEDTDRRYVIHVENLGPGATLPAGNPFGIDPVVRVTVSAPAELTVTAIGGTGWSCALETLTCERSDVLEPGHSYDIDLTVNVPYDAPAEVTFEAAVAGNADNTPDNNTLTDPVTIRQSPDLSVAWNHALEFRQGERGATLSLTVSNSGRETGPTDGPISLGVILPPFMQIVSDSGSSDGWNCEGPGPVATCTRIASLPSPGSSVITFSVNVERDAGGTGRAFAIVDGGGERTARIGENNHAEAEVSIIPMPDLKVTLAGVGSFRQGDPGVYQIVVTNVGTVPTDGKTPTRLTVTLPKGLSAPVLGGGPGWECGPAALTCTTTAGVGVGEMYPPITLLVTVEEDAPALAVVRAELDGASGGQIYTENDIATFDTIIEPAPNLAVSIGHTGTWTQGDAAQSYEIVVSNTGGPTSEPVTVTVSLPVGLTFKGFGTVVGSETDWACTAEGQTITCTYSGPPIPQGSDLPVLTLNVSVNADARPELVTTVRASGGGELGAGVGPENEDQDLTRIDQISDLQVTISHGDFHQGQKGASYSITLENVGLGQTSGEIRLSLTLPADMTAVALTPDGAPDHWTCGPASCTRTEPLEPGTSLTFTGTVDVARDAVENQTVTAAASVGNDNNPDNNQFTDVASVLPMPDLTITMTAAASGFRQGGTSYYQITVTNAGFAPTNGPAIVTDVMPSGVEAVLATVSGWDCSESDYRTVRCTSSDTVQPGDDYGKIDIPVRIADDAASSVTNTATVAGGGQVWVDNDEATITTAVTRAADLAVAMSHTGDFTQGDNGRVYTVQVTNQGGPVTEELEVTVDLPAALSLVDLSGEGWTCVTAAGTCKRSNDMAEYHAITVTVDVSDTAPPWVEPTATVSGGGELQPTIGEDNWATDRTHVVQRPNLAITKSHVGDFFQGQSDARYILTITNEGKGETEAPISVRDDLPTGLEAVGWESDDDFTCTQVEDSFNCTRTVPLKVGESAEIRLTVAVADDAVDLTNTASVTVSGDQDPIDNTAVHSTYVMPMPDLEIKFIEGGPLAQGLPGEVQVEVTNVAGAPTSGTVTVTTVLPGGLTPRDDGGGGDGWSCTAVGQTITCTSTDVVGVGSAFEPLTLKVIVSDDASTSITVVATVSGSGQKNPTNDTAQANIKVTPGPDLTVEISTISEFLQGGTGDLLLTVKNGEAAGPTRGAPVEVTATLPAGLTVQSFQPVLADVSSCQAIAQTVSCTLDMNLAPGASSQAVMIKAQVAFDAPVSLPVSASVSGGGELTPAISNNQTTSNVVIIQRPDLALTKTHLGNFQWGAEDVYTLTVTNRGLGPTVGTITLTDQLPAGLSFVVGTGDGWTCSSDGGSPETVTCQRTAPLGAGAESSTALRVKVAADAPDFLTNTASVSVPEELLVGSENSAADPTTIGFMPDLVVEITGPASVRQADQDVTYTLGVRNVGLEPTDPADPVTVSLTLDPGLNFRGLTGTGDWLCDEAIRTCTTATPVPGPGSFPPILLQVDVADSAPPGATIRVSAAGGGEKQTPSLASLDVKIAQVADLTVNASQAGSFHQGQTGAQISVTVLNSGFGPSDAPFQVSLALPDGLRPTATSLPGQCSSSGQQVTCAFAGPLAVAAPLTFTVSVDVAPTATGGVYEVTVDGGGEWNHSNNRFIWPTMVQPKPNLVLSKSHPGNLRIGGPGLPYTITVSNQGGAPSVAPVMVTDLLPPGLSPAAIGGDGWSCDLATLTCSRTDALAPGASFPPVTLTVTAAAGHAPGTVTNTARVSGGGDVYIADNEAYDLTKIVYPPRPPEPTPPPKPADTVTISAPVSETQRSTIVLSGTANPGASITVNGQSVAVGDDGTWQLRVTLAEGANHFTAVNGQASDSVTVVRDTTPPSLTLTASETETTAEEVTLTAESEPGAEVLVEGRKGLTLVVPLKMGSNTFTATATDRLGNRSTASVTVIRKEPPPPCKFSDLEGHWALEQICRMVEHRVATGYPNGEYRPDQAVTRAEFSAMIARALGLPEVAGRARFSDWASVPLAARGAVNAAVDAGIILGYPDGSFRPNATISRVEMAVLMYRALSVAGLPEVPGEVTFTDWESIPEWGREAVRFCVGHGLLVGYPDGTFGPANTATRAEGTVVIERLWKLLQQ